MIHVVKIYECAKCGCRYPLVPYFPAAAPHGPNKDCSSREWIEVEERFEQTDAGIRYID